MLTTETERAMNTPNAVMFVNPGHLGYYTPKNGVSVVPFLGSMFAKYPRTLAFVDHPPQENKTPDGQYDMSVVNQTQCTCIPKAVCNTYATNEAIYEGLCSVTGIKIRRVRIFDAFNDGITCKMRRPSDCTHYPLSADLWVPVMAAFRRATLELDEIP